MSAQVFTAQQTSLSAAFQDRESFKLERQLDYKSKGHGHVEDYAQLILGRAGSSASGAANPGASRPS